MQGETKHKRIKRWAEGRFNSDELKIVACREKLMTTSQIMRQGQTLYTAGQIRGFLRWKYGKTNTDPLHLHIKSLSENGKSVKEIARRTRLRTSSITTILKKYGISPRLEYLKRVDSKKKARIDREQYAKDLYCWVVDGVSLRDIARENGYARSGPLTGYFNRYIPGYKKASIKRRSQSKVLTKEQQFKKHSVKYRYEADFQKDCISKLRNAGGAPLGEVRAKTPIEIDILTNSCVVELKVTTRKTDLCKALGQLIINSQATGLSPVLCVPSDTHLNGLEQHIKNAGVRIVTEDTIEDIL